MVDEAVRRPTSKPLSVSPCLRALRVNRQEAGQGEAGPGYIFTTEHTEPPFGRYGRRPGKDVLRTFQSCFRPIISGLRDFTPECSEVKSNILVEGMGV